MEFYTKVVGVTYEGRQRLISRLNNNEELEENTELVLKREPDNPYDANAVAVLTLDGQKLGHLAREIAQNVSRSMAAGRRYRAYVSSVTGGDAGMAYGINIRVVYD